MKNIFLTILLLGATIFSTKANTAEVGKPAPDFTLKDSHGKTHKLSDYKGKIVVLEWVNFDCPFVRKHYESGNMQKLQQEMASKGIIWLSVCSSAEGKQGNFSNEEINSRIAKYKAAPTAYLIDEPGTVGKLFDARTTPNMYVISPGQTLAYEGAIDDKPGADMNSISLSLNYVRESVYSLISGGEIKVQTSKPYGCAVKYKN